VIVARREAGHCFSTMQSLYMIIGALIASGFGLLLIRQVQASRRTAAMMTQKLFGDVLPLLAEGSVDESETTGIWKIKGRYGGHLFQLQAIADTLATRKLPSLWLMVTLPEAQPVKATFDLMMRPSGPTTFSKFDFLPVTLPTPAGFPEHAIIRCDGHDALYPSAQVRPHLASFVAGQGKELLVSQKGLRIVVQIAEGDRARYGVFREANFGDTVIDARRALSCMNLLLALRDDLNGA
jgi:hypothetical protein